MKASFIIKAYYGNERLKALEQEFIAYIDKVWVGALFEEGNRVKVSRSDSYNTIDMESDRSSAETDILCTYVSIINIGNMFAAGFLSNPRSRMFYQGEPYFVFEPVIIKGEVSILDKRTVLIRL